MLSHAKCTAMREILDPVDPEEIRPIFGDIFRTLQHGKELEQFQFYEGAIHCVVKNVRLGTRHRDGEFQHAFPRARDLLSLDGTGYFSSSKVHCDSCLEKHHCNGKVSDSHQMLGAAIVHPEVKEVIPVMPEPPK